MPHAGTDAWIARLGRVLRSGTFFIVYACYVACIIGLGQRLLLWPAIVLFPRRRRALTGAWLRAHARATFVIARAIARVRVSVRGVVPPESCIVVMNHQSVLDIPLGLSLVTDPYPLIPTRDRYRRGIPGISPLARLAHFPFVSQRRTMTRAELTALTLAAAAVERGEQSLLIFPEGHRTRDGRIGHFMRSGLRLMLTRARRPIYCIVADGMNASRTTADALLNFADTQIRGIVLGPYQLPSTAHADASGSDAAIDAFIDTLREHMTAALDELRSGSVVPPHNVRTGAANSPAGR